MLPDFLIIGGVRCGTTSLYQQLKRHPRVFMPSVKEPGFFIHKGEPQPEDARIVTELGAYQRLFAGADPDQIVGEASAAYLYRAEVTAPRIRRLVPAVRLVVQLRHPVERAYSQFRMARMVGEETLDDFGEALRRENRRVEAGEHIIFHYRRQSLYYEPLRRFFGCFDRAQIRVTLFRDFVSDPDGTLAGTFDFLGVDPTVQLRNPARASNATRGPRSRTLDRMMNRPGKAGRAVRRLVPGPLKRSLKVALEKKNRAEPIPLDPELRERLAGFFREDVLRVEDLLGRDLREWLN